MSRGDNGAQRRRATCAAQYSHSNISRELSRNSQSVDPPPVSLRKALRPLEASLAVMGWNSSLILSLTHSREVPLVFASRYWWMSYRSRPVPPTGSVTLDSAGSLVFKKSAAPVKPVPGRRMY